MLYADFNGDGLRDVAGRRTNGDWYVGRNTGAGFDTALWGNWNEALGWQDVNSGRFN